MSDRRPYGTKRIPKKRIREILAARVEGAQPSEIAFRFGPSAVYVTEEDLADKRLKKAKAREETHGPRRRSTRVHARKCSRNSVVQEGVEPTCARCKQLIYRENYLKGLRWPE